MNTNELITISILDENVKPILESLREMKAIKVFQPSKPLLALADSMRWPEDDVPSMEEIADIVHEVRRERNGQD